MKKLMLYSLACALLLVAPAIQAETRTWTNAEGKTIQADLVKKEGEQIQVKLTNGTTVKLKLADLSQADQTYTASWEPTEEDTAKTGKEEKKDIKFKWYKREKDALKAARESNLPIVILFTGTSWCGYCVKLESEVLSKPEFKSKMGGAVIGLICISEAPGKFKNKWATELAEKFSVKGYPCMVIISPEGTRIGQLSGFNATLGLEGYIREIKKIAGVPTEKSPS